MARGKKRIAIIVLFVTTGLAFAGTGGYYFYNNNPVMAKKSPVVALNEEEPTIRGGGNVSSLKNEGTIYVSSEEPGITLFLLQKKGEKFEKIQQTMDTIFVVRIGHTYKVMAKKEGYLAFASQEIVMDTPEQYEQVIASLEYDPRIPIVASFTEPRSQEPLKPTN